MDSYKTTWSEVVWGSPNVIRRRGNEQRMGRQATNTYHNALSIQGRQGRAYRPHFAAEKTEAEKGNKNYIVSKGLSQG